MGLATTKRTAKMEAAWERPRALVERFLRRRQERAKISEVRRCQWTGPRRARLLQPAVAAACPTRSASMASTKASHVRFLHSATENSNLWLHFNLLVMSVDVVSDPTVKFLREKMEKAGCPVWPRLLTAMTCKGQSSAGGYSSGRGVSLIWYRTWPFSVVFFLVFLDNMWYCFLIESDSALLLDSVVSQQLESLTFDYVLLLCF